MENEMHFDLTNYENIIASFALVLIIIDLAAFLDNRCRKAEPLSRFGFDHNPNFQPERDDSDDKDRTSNLGTAEQRIMFRGDTQQNLED